MSKHTPGPWEFGRCKQITGIRTIAGWFIGRTGGRKPLLDIGEVYLFASQNEGEQEANARLIAAAPELLEACQSMDADLNDPGCWIGALMSPNPKTVDLIRAAIAKATGTV